jgi:hypothetical protein
MRFIVEEPGASRDTLLPREAESSFLWRVWRGTALPYDRTKAGEDMSSKWDWV